MEEKAVIEKKLLALTKVFLSELDFKVHPPRITLDMRFDQELGIDSLKKAELFHRIEKECHCRLPDSLLVTSRCLRDFVAPLQHHIPSVKQKELLSTPVAPTSPTFDPSESNNLIAVLRGYAASKKPRPHIYLQTESGEEIAINYPKILDQGHCIASHLHSLGVGPRDTVAIMLPTCEHFFYAFFGILLVGAVPVPIYPPFRTDELEEYARRETNILKNAGVRVLITLPAMKVLSRLLRPFVESLFEVYVIDQLLTDQGELPELTVHADDPALIQYTSGSTGNPKGVLLTHHNLLANIRAIGRAINVQADDVLVSWLPLYHDMGLIGSWLSAFYFGIPIVILSPLTFLARPERWLWAIHYYRGTLSAAPNFGYDFCVKKIDEAFIEGLDLSTWRVALNGSETIYPSTLESFAKKFSKYGFKTSALYPAYGLAEAAVALTFPPQSRDPVYDTIERNAFDYLQEAKPVSPAEKNCYQFVSCGTALPGMSVRIVDENNQRLPERKIGSIQFKGSSAMRTYYHNREATQAIRHDGWLDTGDVGYQANHELYIVGRKKDLIIKSGSNFYPADVEAIASTVAGVRKGCVIAFGIDAPAQGTEELIVVAESHCKGKAEQRQIQRQIINKMTAQLGLTPDRIILIPPKMLPKTSSGKLQRSRCKSDYLAGKIVQHRKPVWLQVGMLFMRSFVKKTMNAFSIAGRVLFTGYIGLLLLLILLPCVLLICVLPSAWRGLSAKYLAQCIVKLSFCPLQVTGRHNLPQQGPVIYVANHTSYIDTLVLLTVLPTSTKFVAKVELLNVPILGTCIRRMGHLMVSRSDIKQNVSDIQRIKSALQKKYSVAIYPESRFTASPGIMSFRLGAFKIAFETNIPLCPISISGMRQVQRGDSLLLRPGRISLTIGQLIQPNLHNESWKEINRLSHLARNEIAMHCQEELIRE